MKGSSGGHRTESWLRAPALPTRLAVLIPRVETAVVAAALVFAVLALGAADGGYFRGSWGWLALASTWVALMALLLRGSIDVSRFELVYLAAFTALLGCSASVVSMQSSASPNWSKPAGTRSVKKGTEALSSR